MPSIIYGNTRDTVTYPSTDMGYKYPLGMNLKPGSPLHQKILDKVCRMADDSYAVMSKRHSTWNDIDNTLKVYIPLSEAENRVKSKDKRKPTSIVVPYSYAMLETILAYMTRAFLSDTVFQYEGSSAEDTIPAKLLELVVQQQVRRFKSVLDIHTTLRDSFSYGLGASTVVWSERWGQKPVMREFPRYSAYGEMVGIDRRRENIPALLFEGNEVVSIDPYRLLPDPNVSIHNVQHGEFLGWIDFVSLYTLLGNESQDESTFNIKYIKQMDQVERLTKYSSDPSSRILKRDDTRTPNSTKYLTRINMYVKLIPKEWGLPATTSGNVNGEYPEIWLFEVINESIITKAAPLGLNHGMYPVSVAAPDYDGYSITPLARMELVGGLQTTLDWMFNSHIANVRKAINDMLIVDPSLVNMEDISNPEPGKLVRLRRAAWGRGVKDAVMQLGVTDITRGHMGDAMTIMEIMQKATAATDSTMGIMRTGGERVTAQEYSGTMQMAVSRLDHIARMVSEQYLIDLAYFHASHTQQLMTESTYVKAVGEWPDILTQEFQRSGIQYGGKVLVDPMDLLIDFDVIFRDGATTTASANENQFWTSMFQIFSTNPVLAQTFDVVRIFKHIARLNGAKNVNDFIANGGGMQSAQMPDEQVMEEADKGNLVSIEDYMAQQGGTGY